tara:strand:+ start:2463 stop:2858 length:396 start_codon:yes stop_codon:yes gene_type:complete
LASHKQLFTVFTNKLLFLEWILQILRAVSIYFLNKKARLEVDQFAVDNDTLDMRTVSSTIKRGVIHDQAILDMRWGLCTGCEFLTENNSCQKCGCYMSVKHKLAFARCPIGKWDRYSITDEKVLSGSPLPS